MEKEQGAINTIDSKRSVEVNNTVKIESLEGRMFIATATSFKRLLCHCGRKPKLIEWSMGYSVSDDRYQMQCKCGGRSGTFYNPEHAVIDWNLQQFKAKEGVANP